MSERLLAGNTKDTTIQPQSDAFKVVKLICADMGYDSLSASRLPVHSWCPTKHNKNVYEGRWEDVVPFVKINGGNASEYDNYFHVGSCQFAMHYMFQSLAQASNFFAEISKYLCVGGVFVATTIDCRVVTDLLLNQRYGSSCGGNRSTNSNLSSKTDSDNNDSGDSGAIDLFEEVIKSHRPLVPIDRDQEKMVLEFRNDFGDLLLELSFQPQHWKRLVAHDKTTSSDTNSNGSSDSETNGNGRGIDGVGGGADCVAVNSNNTRRSLEEFTDCFGIEYTFALRDNTEEAAVNAPEWIVPLGAPLEALAAEHDLEIVSCRNFHEIYSDCIEKKGLQSKYVSRCN